MNFKRPNILSQIFRELRQRIKKKLNIQSEIPWMRPKELDIITELLYRLNPKFCFEWGSGYSTLYFPTFSSALEKWYSLEHNEEWYKIIAPEIKDPRVSLTFVKAEKDPGRGRYNIKLEGTYDEFRSYVDYPEQLQVKFDFMLIDGRARVDCLHKAYQLISDSGVVMLHDANRENYTQDLPPFKHIVQFKDHRKREGGILLLSKERDLNSVLAIKSHQSVWKIHNIIAKIRL